MAVHMIGVRTVTYGQKGAEARNARWVEVEALLELDWVAVVQVALRGL